MPESQEPKHGTLYFDVSLDLQGTGASFVLAPLADEQLMRSVKLLFAKATEDVGKHECVLITFHAAAFLRVAATAHQG